MVRRLIGIFGREVKGLHEAAYLLAIFAFISHLLALIRDRLLASNFGASELIDVYYASFRIPDLIFVLMTFFVSTAVLIPFLSDHIENKTEVKKLINSLFSIFLITIILISILVFIFAEPLLNLAVPGLMNGEYAETLILFTKILLLSPILLGISQLFGSVVQAYRKFFVYAISPVLYNLGIIIGIVYFYPIFGVVGLVYGVVLGSLLHVLIQVSTVCKHKLIPKFTFNIDWSAVKQVTKLSLPRTLTLGTTQITLLVLTAIASTFVAGSIAIFNFAHNLQAVPLSIIGVSYSLAAFPTLSRLFASGDKENFLAQLITSARHIIFWSFPVIVMFVVLRAQIIRTVLGAGEFDWNDTRLTAAALAIFAISVLAQSLILLFVRGYYAAGKTKKPLIMNFISMAVTIVLSFIFVGIFNQNEGFKIFFEDLFRVSGIDGTVILMLPLAFSIGMILNVVMLWCSFEKEFKGFSQSLWKTFNHSLLASLIAGFIAYLFLGVFSNTFDLDTLLGIFSQGLFAGIIGLFGGVIVLKLIKNPEIETVWKTLHKKVWRVKPSVPDQEELYFH